MATENGTTSDLIEFYELLEGHPYLTDFYFALRKLECLHSDKPKLGEAVKLTDEPIRIKQEASLAFANSTLQSFKRGQEGKPAVLIQNFLGLFGSNGPLPHHLTEYARERSRNASDPVLTDFLNIFHHRMLAMFYRAWADAEPVNSLDRPNEDKFFDYIGSLIGIGMTSMRARDNMHDHSKLYYAGLLSNQVKNAHNLEMLLQDYFDVDTHVEQFVGHWLELRVDDCWQLNKSHNTGVLSENAILGLKVWDCQSKYRIIFRVDNYQLFIGLLPVGETMASIVSVVQNYIGDELDWDMQLILQADQVPQWKLGEIGYLGWNSWLNERKIDKDADDLVLNPKKYLYYS